MELRRTLLAGAVAAVVTLAAATATGRTAPPGTLDGATPPAAPFAQAFASVPTTPLGRKARRVLVVGMEQNVDGFNTALNCCSEYWAVVTGSTPVVRGAYLITDTLAYEPDLVQKAIATPTSLTYVIRGDAYWNWGGRKLPVTYRDFVYTWRQLLDPNNDVASRDGYDQITGYTHRGEKQITFSWTKPYADYRDLFGVVYPSRALAGTDFDKIWSDCVCGADGKPVSDGPFLLTNYTKGQGVTLRANPYWYGAKPGLREIDFRVVTDTGAEVQAMLGGAVDAIAPAPQPPLVQLQHQIGITYTAVPGLYQEHVDLQFGGKGQPLLRQPWMRQALMLGMNRQAVVTALFGDVAPGLTPLNSLLFYQRDRANYRPDFARWNYDPRKALALLRRHCTGGPARPTVGNTRFFTCNGRPAQFAYTTIAGNRRRATSESMLKADLGAIGIQVTDNLLPASVAFGPTVLGAGNFDLFEYAWVTASPDPAGFVQTWGCGALQNFLNYCSRKVTALLDAASRELDPARRAADFRKADVLLANDLPSIPLYAQPSLLIYRSAIAGMADNPSSSGFSWNAEDWRWKLPRRSPS